MLLLFFESCKEDEEIRPGCEGTTINQLVNVQVLMTFSVTGVVFVSDEFGVLLPCSRNPEVFKSVYDKYLESPDYNWRTINDNGIWVNITGSIKKAHPEKNIISTDLFNIDLTGIYESTEEYIPNEIIIEIFEVSYQDTIGYGYYIDYDGFTISQNQIPGLPGFQPFKTKAEALKIAYLTAYKLKHESGLPSTTKSELDFFYIDHD
jgi:hypothetical protein